MRKPAVKARILRLGVGAALAVAASPPAQAQFMTGNYPVLIVPPPAQNLVVPKPKPVQAPKPASRADDLLVRGLVFEDPNWATPTSTSE
jgi:hypothetical protein